MCFNCISRTQLAVSTDRREMARFLYDAMMFDVLPYWSPTAAAAVLVAGLFLLIKVQFAYCVGCVYVC